MIKFVIIILFDFLILVVWPLLFLNKRLSSHKKRQWQLKLLQNQLKQQLLWNRDILTQAQQRILQVLAQEAAVLRQSTDIQAIDTFLANSETQLQEALTPLRFRIPKEITETVIIILAVILGINSLFLKPFKIPTGSMQPTLYGIHFVELPENNKMNVIQRFLGYLNFSRRYVDIQLQKDARLVFTRHKQLYPHHAPQSHNRFFFLTSTRIYFDNQDYTLPGDAEKISQYLWDYNKKHNANRLSGKTFYLKKGDTLVRGALELGDHVLVDRIRYHFSEPQRGDIIIFTTEDISEGTRGRYYIKRLIGLPGDQLMIKNQRVWIKAKGSSKWRTVNAGDHHAFERLYSFKDGYNGHSKYGPFSSISLAEPDEYFVLGDNTDNSQDSRYWGPIFRKRIIGRAGIIYWPFSNRWGIADQNHGL